MADPLPSPASRSIDEEKFAKAIKLLEALCAPHDGIDANGDHVWRKCRPCLAAFELALDEEQYAASGGTSESQKLLSLVLAAVRAEAHPSASKGSWTDEQVLKALENSGIDTSCGACVEVAFTGVTTYAHTCHPSASRDKEKP